MHVTQIELEFVELPHLPDETAPGFVPNPSLPVQPNYLLSMWDCSCRLAIWDGQLRVFRDHVGKLNALAIRAWATLPKPVDWPGWGDAVARAAKANAVSVEFPNAGWLEPHYIEQPTQSAAKLAYAAYRERAGGCAWAQLPEANQADWLAVAARLTASH